MPYFRAFVKNLTMARATRRLVTDRLSPKMDPSSNYGFAKGALCEFGPGPAGTTPRARLSSSAASPFVGIGDRRPVDRSRQRVAMKSFLRGPARVDHRGGENRSSQSHDKSIAVSSRSPAGYPRTHSRRAPGHETLLTPCKAALPNRPLPRKKQEPVNCATLLSSCQLNRGTQPGSHRFPPIPAAVIPSGKKVKTVDISRLNA